ncbi:MAG: WYL domain-containing protein [Gammaproteobacteria bacterium]|nr:WYL domain-containing protein [Gammaproteobacteria bacterium]MCP5135266.1 WYL domain-containing protein [Gammaproteobacteria bacterium]
MDRFERILTLHRILTDRRTPVSRRELEDQLGSNRSTVKRTIDDMRTHLNAPIVYRRDSNGYVYEKTDSHHIWFELPGLWFNSDELFALLTSHTLLSRIQPGLLDTYIQPFLARIEEQLPRLVHGNDKADWRQINDRVRILQQAARPAPVESFQQIVGALIRRQRLKILYHGRERDKHTERVVSPQRLIYYRDNWYLDAWCHLREGLRSFALDRIHPVKYEVQAAQEIPAADLDAHYTAAYGIFAGPVTAEAHLRFTPHAAKWVADEHWHPEQRMEFPDGGGVDLFIPYGDARELIRDILKYGPDVEALAPKNLRESIQTILRDALSRYSENAKQDTGERAEPDRSR